MDKNKQLQARRQRRRYHNRKPVRGTSERPRLCVQRTLKHFGCQLIDDQSGRTLASVSTRDKNLRDALGYGGNAEAAARLGKEIAERAIAAGIRQVRLDRGHAKYHGRVKAFADAAREGGLAF